MVGESDPVGQGEGKVVREELSELESVGEREGEGVCVPVGLPEAVAQSEAV